MQINFTIPDEKLQRIIDAIKWSYPIPEIPVDEEKPELGTKSEFTDNQWAKERIRRFVIDTVHHAEREAAEREVQRDDALIS